MRMRKMLTLIVVMLLSLAIFASNLAGLKMAVQAAEIEEYLENEQYGEEEGYEEPEGDPEDDNGSDEEEEERLRREAEEELKRQQEEEEKRRQEQEELERQAREAEEQRQAEEQERLEQEKKRAQEEAEKQAALEREAEKAAEAQRKAEEEAAAAEALRKAEEEAKKAAEEAEKARQAEEEQKKQEEYSYGLRISKDGGELSGIGLSAAVGNGDFMIFSVSNTGMSNIDLVYGISKADADVFALSLIDGSTQLAPSEMSKFQVALRSSAPVGDYKATLFFKDKNDDQNKFTRYINVTGSVTRASKVTKVNVSPQGMVLSTGGSARFYADVWGEDVLQDVTWSINGAKSCDTYINLDGELTVALNEKSSKITVVATSAQDPAISGYSTVGIQSGSLNVNVYAEPQKGGMVSGGGAVVRGGSVTLSAIPQKNYYFEGWVRDGKIVSTATNYTIKDVQYNIDVTAKFKKNYVTVNAAPDNDRAGSVVGGGKITYGGRTTLSAKANDGYVFTGWKEGKSIISTEASIELKNITVDRTITAKFSKTSFNITLACSPADGGTVTGGGKYKLSESAVIEAKPASGFVFQGWTVNDQVVSRDASYKINKVEKDYCFTAVFIPEGIMTHKITAGVATTGGTISPSGVTTVARGSSVTYRITPKSGFAILAVAVDGVQVGPVDMFIFPDIRTDHVIAAAFVQTDAGMKMAQASGDTDVQTKKVQKVYKDTTEDVALEERVVDLDDAVSGTAGDDYIEDMDLSEVAIPTDEELGIVQDDPVVDSPVLKYMGLSLDEAKSLIDNGESAQVLNAAFYAGNLDAYADNQFAPAMPEIDYHSLNREELEQVSDDLIYPSFPNYDVVVQKVITPSEAMEIAEGGYANLSISLTKTDNTIDPSSKKVLDSAIGQRPLKYFDLTFIKSVGGATVNVKQMDVPMEVIIEIPDDIYKKNKTYSILREHSGELSILPDLDDDPKTITFRTDRFSAYAIAEQKATAKDIAIRFMIGALIALIIAVACFIILMYHHVQMRRAKKRKRTEYV